MGSHKHIGCTVSDCKRTIKPPVPDIIMTGDGDPDPNGNYFLMKPMNGKNAYRREPGGYYIWWGPGEFAWFLSVDSNGDEDADAWIHVGPNEFGRYVAYQGTSGNPFATKNG